MHESGFVNLDQNLKVEKGINPFNASITFLMKGETAPGNRKGMCAMHLRDVERFLSGHHLGGLHLVNWRTIHATAEAAMDLLPTAWSAAKRDDDISATAAARFTFTEVEEAKCQCHRQAIWTNS